MKRTRRLAPWALALLALCGAGCSSHYDMQDLDAEGEVFLKEARLQKRADNYPQAAKLFADANGKFEAAHEISVERENNTIGGHLRLKIAIVYGLQGDCLRPDLTEGEGDWDRALELYRQAAAWSLRGNFLRMQRDMIVKEAECLRPDKNPAGDWAKAAARYAKAIKISTEIEDDEGKGAVLYDRAVCLLEGQNLERLGPETKKLLVEANSLGDKRAAQLLAKTGERYCRQCSESIPDKQARFCPKCGADQVPPAKVEKTPPPRQPPPG